MLADDLSQETHQRDGRRWKIPVKQGVQLNLTVMLELIDGHKVAVWHRKYLTKRGKSLRMVVVVQ